jgi:DNA (cytosine-5)-methyltransferase 1
MSHVDLCAGIGGFSLGFSWSGLSAPVLFCEIDPWCRKILAKHWPDVPIAHDVKELANDPTRLVPDCDILTAGYPCQPFSVAGKQRGAEDDRHIWPQIFTIVQAKRPNWCVFENVSGHISLGLDEVLSDLESEGYAVQPFVVPACAVNAPHRRDRIWIIAHTNSHGEPDGAINEKQGCGKLVGNSEYDGSSAATVSGKHREDEAGCAERQIASEQSEGASEPGHDANVGNAAHNGRNSGAAQAHRERAAYQSGQSQSGLWGKFIGSGENVADTRSERLEGQLRSQLQGTREGFTNSSERNREDVADTTSQRQQRQGSSRDASNSTQRGEGQATEFINGGFGDKRQLESRMGDLVDGLPKGLDRFDGWEREPADIPRVATGVKDRKNRLMGLGNAIVPSIAMQIGLTIKAVRDA